MDNFARFVRFFLVLGGFAGFLLAFVLSLAAGADAVVLLRNAAIGCFVGGSLVLVFLHVLYHLIRQAKRSRRRRRLAAEEKTEHNARAERLAEESASTAATSPETLS